MVGRIGRSARRGRHRHEKRWHADRSGRGSPLSDQVERLRRLEREALGRRPGPRDIRGMVGGQLRQQQHEVGVDGPGGQRRPARHVKIRVHRKHCHRCL